MPDTAGVTGDQLKSFIERIERLEDEKAEIAEQIRQVMAEAKGEGFDAKVLRQVVKLRKLQEDDRHEQEELLEVYKSAIGMF